MRLFGNTHQDKATIGPEGGEIRIQIMRCRHAINDDIQSVPAGYHLLHIAGNHDPIGTQASGILAFFR